MIEKRLGYVLVFYNYVELKKDSLGLFIKFKLYICF